MLLYPSDKEEFGNKERTQKQVLNYNLNFGFGISNEASNGRNEGKSNYKINYLNF
jgi:hypothetical protein